MWYEDALWSESGTAHSVTVTAANVARINVLPKGWRSKTKLSLASYASNEYKRGSHVFRICLVSAGQVQTRRRSFEQPRRRVRVTVNSLLFGHEWNRYSGCQARARTRQDLLPDEAHYPSEHAGDLANLYLLRGLKASSGRQRYRVRPLCLQTDCDRKNGIPAMKCCRPTQLRQTWQHHIKTWKILFVQRFPKERQCNLHSTRIIHYGF